MDRSAGAAGERDEAVARPQEPAPAPATDSRPLAGALPGGPLVPGDFVPPFVAPAPHNPQFHLHAVAGMRLLLLFLGNAGGPEVRGILAAVKGQSGILAQREIRLMVIGPRGVESRGAEGGDTAFRPADCTWIWDEDGSIAASFGLQRDDLETGGIRPTAFLLKENLQLLARFDATEPTGFAGALGALAAQLPAPEAYRRAEFQAPVLLVPGALPPGLCRDLIAYYERRGGTPSGFMRDHGGRTVGLHDPGMKRRNDCMIEDAQLLGAIRRMLLRRVAPEIRKAFGFHATRVERYIVARYDAAEGGFFRAHRDNTSRGTAHRRFAMTVNLNSEGFEGGELWFPEYGRSLHKPPTGAALVFSCSMLHEARPVTAGLRYAFLPFFYDDAAAEIRLQNLQFVAPPAEPGPSVLEPAVPEPASLAQVARRPAGADPANPARDPSAPLGRRG